MGNSWSLRVPVLIALALVWTLTLPATAESQLAGTKPDKLDDSEVLHVIGSLEKVFPENMGFRVHAPLSPESGCFGDTERLVRAFRVIVPKDITVVEAARRLTTGDSPFARFLEMEQGTGFLPVMPVGYAGVPVTAKLGKKLIDVQFLTVNMDRWLIWARTCYFPVWKSDGDTPIQEYAAEVSQYLRGTDFGSGGDTELDPSAFGAPEKADLFGGYESERHELARYKELVAANREMDLEIATGVTSFTAAKSAVEWIIDKRGDDTYADPRQAQLQKVFFKFIAEERDFQELRTLTPYVIEELTPGRYFYAVDKYGRVRFGPMYFTPEEGQAGLWRERMKSYECLLFPGQEIVAAGEFEISTGKGTLEASLTGGSAPKRRISSVNAFSSYYYYRPSDKNLEGRIEGESDSHVRDIGHLFERLEDMGIEIGEVKVSKF